MAPPAPQFTGTAEDLREMLASPALLGATLVGDDMMRALNALPDEELGASSGDDEGGGGGHRWSEPAGPCYDDAPAVPRFVRGGAPARGKPSRMGAPGARQPSPSRVPPPAASYAASSADETVSATGYCSAGHTGAGEDDPLRKSDTFDMAEYLRELNGPGEDGGGGGDGGRGGEGGGSGQGCPEFDQASLRALRSGSTDSIDAPLEDAAPGGRGSPAYFGGSGAVHIDLGATFAGGEWDSDEPRGGLGGQVDSWQGLPLSPILEARTLEREAQRTGSLGTLTGTLRSEQDGGGGLEQMHRTSSSAGGKRAEGIAERVVSVEGQGGAPTPTPEGVEGTGIVALQRPRPAPRGRAAEGGCGPTPLPRRTRLSPSSSLGSRDGTEGGGALPATPVRSTLPSIRRGGEPQAPREPEPATPTGAPRPRGDAAPAHTHVPTPRPGATGAFPGRSLGPSVDRSTPPGPWAPANSDPGSAPAAVHSLAERRGWAVLKGHQVLIGGTPERGSPLVVVTPGAEAATLGPGPSLRSPAARLGPPMTREMRVAGRRSSVGADVEGPPPPRAVRGAPAARGGPAAPAPTARVRLSRQLESSDVPAAAAAWGTPASPAARSSAPKARPAALTLTRYSAASPQPALSLADRFERTLADGAAGHPPRRPRASPTPPEDRSEGEVMAERLGRERLQMERALWGPSLGTPAASERARLRSSTSAGRDGALSLSDAALGPLLEAAMAAAVGTGRGGSHREAGSASGLPVLGRRGSHHR